MFRVDKIESKAICIMYQLTECNADAKFWEARRKIYTLPNTISKAIQFYNLYLFYHRGFGGVVKNEDSALENLRQSMTLGYPQAGMDLANYYFKKQNLFEAENCIEKCSEEFLKKDNLEREKYEEEYKDMMRLLRKIKLEINAENLSDGSIGPENAYSDMSCTPPDSGYKTTIPIISCP